MDRLDEPIQISGLGRKVFIGNLYNYLHGHVLPSGIQVPWSSFKIQNLSPPETRHSFFYQHTLKFRDSSFGIDSHVKENIHRRLMNPNNFWFAKYLNSSTQTEANYVGSCVIVHFRVVRRTDTMDLNFLQTQLQNYQADCNGRATHVVKQVNYGSEFIICMRKPVDYNKETKDSAEYNMYRAAVKYFDKAIETNWTSTEISTELADVSCTIFNSLNVNYVMVDSLQHSVNWLKSAIKLDGRHEKWLEWTLPVDIVLHHIPTRFDNGRLFPLISSNKEKDAQLEIDRIWCDLWNEYRFLESHRVYKTLNNRQRIPLNSLPVCLHDIGAQLISVREQFIRKNTDKALIKEFMVLASQWIGHRREQFQIFNEIYDELDRLPFVHLQHVTPLRPTSSQHNLKLFVILFFYEQDVLLFEIENLVSSLLLIPSVRRTIFRANFPIFSTGKESFSIFKNQLKDFVEEAKRCANANNVYKFGLVPVGSNPTPKLKDGDIKTIVYPAIKNTPSQTCLPTNPVQQHRRDLIPDDALNPQIPIGAPSTSRQEQIDSSLIDSKLPNTLGQRQTKLRHQQDPPSLNSSVPATMVSPANSSASSLPSSSNQERINEKLPDAGTLPSLPVEIVLHHIPTPCDNGRLFTLISSNKEKDEQLEIEKIWYDLLNDYRLLESHRAYKILHNRQRIPLKASPLCPKKFGDFLNILRKRFNGMKSDHAPIKDLLERSSQWIGRRREELEILAGFCDELDRLPFVHMHLLKSLPPNSNQQNMKLFIILFEYKQDALLSEIEKLVRNSTVMPNIRRTIFPITSASKESISVFKNRLKDFVEEAQRCANTNVIYKFGLVHFFPNWKKGPKDGEIKTWVYPAIKNTPTQSCLPKITGKQHIRLDPIPPGAFNPPNSIGAPSTSRQIDNSIVDSKLPDIRPAQQKTNMHDQQNPPLLVCPIPPTSMDLDLPANPSASSLPSTSNQERINEKLPDAGTLPSLLKRQLDHAPKASLAIVPATESNTEIVCQGPPLKKTKCNALAKAPVVDTERIQTRSQTKVLSLQTQESAKPTASGNSTKTKSSSTPSNRQLLLETLLNDIELEVLLGNVENLEMTNILGRDISECVVTKTSLRPSLKPCSDGFKAYNCRRCRVTCEKPSKQNLDNTERKNCELCPCPVSDHALQPFEWSRKRVDTEVKVSSQNMLESELLSAKEKVLSLLRRMASKNIPSVANKAVMPSSPADYLDLLKAHIIKQQRPGYLTRLKTLADLRKNV